MAAARFEDGSAYNRLPDGTLPYDHDLTKLTLALCQAIYLEGGTAGVQAPDLDASRLCGGYELESGEVFDATGGDKDYDGLQSVSVEVTVSDPSEAALMCVNRSGALATSLSFTGLRRYEPDCSVNAAGSVSSFIGKRLGGNFPYHRWPSRILR